tara:strand:+ start:573 stop:818 length:246 start_codon:yes stop_codon:yes gene_type:complete
MREPCSKEQAIKHVEKALQDFLGILGMSKVNPVVMKDKMKNNKGIVRINHRFKDEVIVALSLAKADVIHVSGILNKAVRYL